MVRWVEVRVGEQREGGQLWRHTSYVSDEPVSLAVPREQVQASTSEPAQQSVPPYRSGLVQYLWLQLVFVFRGGGGAGDGGGGRICPVARLTPRTGSRCRKTDMSNRSLTS